MFTSLLFLLFVNFAASSDIAVRYGNSWYGMRKPGPIISDKNVKYDTTEVFIKNYDPDETQITRIENLPNLEWVGVIETSQKVTITFKNVPKFRRLAMTRNDINYVGAHQFSDTDLESIWIFGNKISVIEDGSFGRNIKVVSMYCNYIESFRPEWFVNPSIVTVLDLNGNRIKLIRKGAFKAFTSLKNIQLAHNLIMTIGSQAFASRNNFKNILLAHNNLRTIDSNLFHPDDLSFDYLDIRYNNLTFLPLELLNRLSVKKTPLIDGNPWQCSCYRHHILKWANWTTYGDDRFNPKDREDEPRCVSTIGSFANTCLEFVSEELITYFQENSSPPPTERNKYCECIRNAVNGVGDWECYFGEDFKYVTPPE